MSNWLYGIQGWGLSLLSAITQHTARYHVEGLEHLTQAQESGKPIIFAAWHGMTMMLAGFFLKHLADTSKLVLMMPDDRRGEALKRWALRINARPYPMNLEGDDSMSMARQFARLMRLVRQGYMTYVTPDGPHGPAYEMKPGIAFLAQKTGAVLLPLGAFTRQGFRLNRWDQYTVPYLFARIHLSISAPIPVANDANHEEITEALIDRLHRVSARAITSYYE